MGNTGPTWQTIATACASIIFSVGLGVGGYFIAQQATRDSRQDQLLDTITTKLVDVSIAMVTLRTGQEEVKTMVTKEATLREERDRRELEDYRQRQAPQPAIPAGKEGARR